jgi:hypothetical protein
VLLGNGDGTFGTKTDFATGGWPVVVAIADLNADQRPDLAVATALTPGGFEGGRTISVLLGNGDGTFKPKTDLATGYAPASVAIGDLNGDGRPDLAVANSRAATVSVLLGNGDGSFGSNTDFIAGYYPLAVAIGDLDGDGRPDLAVTNEGSNSVSALLGDGHGRFESRTHFGTDNSPYSGTIADLNGDGRLDLVVANSGSNTVSVLLNLSPIGPTPTLLARFDGSWSSRGIEVRWQLTGPVHMNVKLERAESLAGPWNVVDGNRNDDGGAVIVLDHEIEAGHTYHYRLRAAMPNGTVWTSGAITVVAGDAVLESLPLSVMPNPTRNLSTVQFVVESSERIRLSILDVEGRTVARLAEGVYRPGRYSVVWNAHDDRNQAPAGLYFVRYEAARRKSMRRLLLAP